MTKTKLTELQNEITRLQAIDNKITKRVAAEFDAKDFEDNAPEHEPDYIDFINSGGNPLELNQSNESLIARHNTKLSSEFVSAWTQEDCNEFIEVGCSLQQDMEWANESENLI